MKTSKLLFKSQEKVTDNQTKFVTKSNCIRQYILQIDWVFALTFDSEDLFQQKEGKIYNKNI